MVVHYPRTVWKICYAEHKETGKTYKKKVYLQKGYGSFPLTRLCDLGFSTTGAAGLTSSWRAGFIGNGGDTLQRGCLNL